MINKIFDLLFPPVCGVCGKLDKNSLCKKCEIGLKSQAVFGIDDYSNSLDKFFEEHLYVFMYGGIIRNMILNYKFNEKSYLYKAFTNYLLKNKKFVEFIKSYDIIVPVPLAKERKKIRGYNQSELIASEISKSLKIQISNNIKKIKNTEKQSLLSGKERQNNIFGAYKLNNFEIFYDRKVLIVDDVYTTGSTANECSRELIKAGTKKIGILTIAKD